MADVGVVADVGAVEDVGDVGDVGPGPYPYSLRPSCGIYAFLSPRSLPRISIVDFQGKHSIPEQNSQGQVKFLGYQIASTSTPFHQVGPHSPKLATLLVEHRVDPRKANRVGAKGVLPLS